MKNIMVDLNIAIHKKIYDHMNPWRGSFFDVIHNDLNDRLCNMLSTPIYSSCLIKIHGCHEEIEDQQERI